MKSILKLTSIILIVSIFSSCTQQTPDPEKAQSFIETFMKKVNDGDLTELSKYYSEEMTNGENDNSRIEKFKQLNRALGKTVSYVLLEKKAVQEVDSPPSVSLVYEVKHQNQVVIETYSVIKEGDDYKIAKQNTVSKLH